MLRDQQYALYQSVSRDHDAPSINPGLAQLLTNDIPTENETHESSGTLLPQHQGFLSHPPMSPLDQIHHRHPIPFDSQAHIPATKLPETEETDFRINAKPAHRALKRRAARQKFEEQFSPSRKRQKPYINESRHKHNKWLLRGPDGRFLAKAKVAAMANGTDGEGDEGSIISTTICPLAATFQGHINTAFDALIVFEACLSNKLNPISRRPESTELLELIQSGNVFVYKVEESGIKRWRDGVSWGSGYKLESFLVYQELEQSSIPGKKKNGLVKKTIEITYESEKYRLVSYYKWEDIEQGRFPPPSQDPELGRIAPRAELLKQIFGALINTTGVNSTLDHFHGPAPMTYGYSLPVVQQGEISMDYSTEVAGFYYAHQYPLLSFPQPQYEDQQNAILYSLPYYSDEQLATLTQSSGVEILMQPMKVEPYVWDLTRCPLSMCPDNVQDLEKADIERYI